MKVKTLHKHLLTEANLSYKKYVGMMMSDFSRYVAVEITGAINCIHL